MPRCVEILAKKHSFKLLAAECKINGKTSKRKRQDEDTPEDAAEEEPSDTGKLKPAAKSKSKAKAKAKAKA